jgi:hypothetical protein
MDLGTAIFASVGIVTFVVCLHTKVGRWLLIAMVLLIATGYGALLVMWHQEATADAAAKAAKVAEYCAEAPSPKDGPFKRGRFDWDPALENQCKPWQNAPLVNNKTPLFDTDLPYWPRKKLAPSAQSESQLLAASCVA